MVGRIFLLLGFLLLSAMAQARGLSAEVDRLQIGLGEQVELKVTLSGVRGRRPDMSGLMKSFSIDRQSQSSNVQIINGLVSQEVSWVFLLSPNSKGKLTIPAFKVDRFSSDAIELTVTDMPVSQSTSDDVLIEVELTPANPYVQSQVAYVQRLYFSRSLLNNSSISKPKLSLGDADIQFWGASDPRYVTHNSRPYQLVERYYIVYPRKAGTLEFEPSVFNGSLASSRQQNDFQMNGFRRGTRANAYSEKASIEIKDKPAGYPSEHWLPASNVSLSMSFSQPLDTLRAGEPVTVTVALIAEGLKAEVLPEVVFDLPDAIKSYPEKPSFQTDKVTNGMVGLRQEKIILIANVAGEYVIPEVRIPWWSLTEDALKEAKLEQVVLKVGLGVVSPPSAVNNVPQGDELISNNLLDTNNNEASSEVEEMVSEVPAEANALFASQQSSVIDFIDRNQRLLVIGLLLMLVGLLMSWVLWRLRKVRINSSEYQQKQRVGEAMESLGAACRSNNLKAAIVVLPKWADAAGIVPATLVGMEAAGDPQLSAAVKAMTAARYSRDSIEWSGESMLIAAKQYSATSRVRQSAELGLSPLHPVLP